MARTTAEIQADLDRLNAELAEADAAVDDTVEEMVEVIDEAVEAHEEVTEEAAEDVVEDVVEAIEEAVEEVIEESPLADEDTPDEVVERDLVAEVITALEDKYDLTPKVVAVTEEAPTEDAVEVVTPQPTHWMAKRIW